MKWLDALLHKNKKRIALQLDGDLIRYCVLDPSSAIPEIESMDEAPLPGNPERLNSFQKLIGRLGVKGADAFWLLSGDQYRLFNIERPAVPDSELTEAIRWQIKDQLDFPVEDAVIDHFPFPGSLLGVSRLYAVVAHRSLIRQLVSLTESANLNLNTIDIAELATGNLLQEQLTPGLNMAYIGENARGVTLNCYFGEEFCFTRSLPGVFFPRQSEKDDLSLDVDIGQGSSDEALLLEVQRTLDYYESQVSRQAVTRLIVPDLGQDTDNLIRLFSDNLGLNVDALNLENRCRWRDGLSAALIARRVGLCGCLFRNEGVAHATS